MFRPGVRELSGLDSLGRRSRSECLRPKALSEKRKLPAFLLCLFFGFFGVHRYYVGKVATGLLQLFTVGGLGLWWLLDLLVILLGGFTDKEGRLITKWV